METTILIRILQLIICLSLIVVTHEFGHYFFARIFNVKVEKFYLFLNPWFSLFKYKSQNDGTEYGIGWLPFGGYVKIAGMIDESLDGEVLKRTQETWEFRAKPVWNRLLIIIGGVLMNFILAFFIYSMIVFKCGDRYIPINKTPLLFSEIAHKVGFQDGDIILASDSKILTRLDELDLFRVIDARNVLVLRGKAKKEIVLPYDFRLQVISSGKMSIFPKPPFTLLNRKCNFPQAFSAGFALSIRKLSFYLLQLKLLFTKTGIKNIGGFGAIAGLFHPSLDWLSFWNTTAFLSIMLGAMNFLPIPALDGGHVIFLLYEIITRRRPNEKFIEKTQIVGMILLFLLLIYANMMDIFRALFK